MKRGQMEIIGLVIIVILITLGMLFMAQFALKPDGAKKVFVRKGLAYSTTTALLKTTMSGFDCSVNDFADNPQLGNELLEDCASAYPSESLSDYEYNCNQQTSCDFVEEQVGSFLQETIGKWGKNYQFTSRLVSIRGVEPQTIVEIKSNEGSADAGCPKYKERDSSGLFPLQTRAGLIETTLLVCD